MNTGQSDCLYGLWPDDGFQGAEFVKQGAYIDNSGLHRRPGDNLYVIVSSYGKYGEIFSVMGNRVISKKILFDEYPDYTTRDGLNVSYSGMNAMGLKIFATREYIYVKLHKGNLAEYRERKHSSDYYFGADEIWVYDWEGHLQKKYALDKKISNLFVSEDDSKMWGLTTDEEREGSYFLRFDLP